jgi:hypothetical protein
LPDQISRLSGATFANTVTPQKGYRLSISDGKPRWTTIKVFHLDKEDENRIDIIT